MKSLPFPQLINRQHLRYPTLVILLLLNSLLPHAGNFQPDFKIRDSIFKVRPHETEIQKAYIYLEVADQIRQYQPQKSFSYVVSAFKIALWENCDSLKAYSRIRMGDYYNDRRKFIQAHEQYLAAWKIYHFIGDEKGEVNALLNVAMINRNLRNLEKSLSYLTKCLILVKKVRSHSLSGLVNENIARVYQIMRDQETARYYYSKALADFRLAGDKQKEFWARSDLGSIYLDEDKYLEALNYYTRLLEEANSANPEFLGLVYTRIGHTYDKLNDSRSSLKYNFMALKVRTLGRRPAEVNSSLINVGGDYFKLGIPDSAKLFIDSGLIIAQRCDQKTLVENAYRHLYGYYLRVENFQKALEYYEKYCLMRDAINLEQYRNNIAILETNQKLQQIQQSGKLIARQNDIQALKLKYHDFQSIILQVMMGIAGFSMMVFVVLLLYIHRVRRKMQEINVQLSEEIRERETAEEQILDRETQYRFITDNSLDFITHIDDRKEWIYLSPSSRMVYGYEPDEMVSLPPFALIHPEYHQFVKSAFNHILNTRQQQQIEFQAIKKDGTIFWAESVLTPLFNPVSGIYKGMVGVTRDIQARKTKELEIMEGTKQTENLLKEIHHRVKNNFAILVSLINMQMGQTNNQELLQSLTNLQLRIRTMALVHEMLYRSGDFEKISFPGYLNSLASVIAGTFNRRNVDLIIEADEVVMDIETLIPMGLIVNEILSNAYKHAFPQDQKGRIAISFTRDAKTRVSMLAIKDDGVGLPEGMTSGNFRTMGLQVVQILCSQIEAAMELSNNPGASFVITFQSRVG